MRVDSHHNNTLLEPSRFKAAVFARDGHSCTVCLATGVSVGGDAILDAHRILDGRLWDDGGYYQDNGVVLCDNCRLQADMTVLSCEELRKCAGIGITLLPPHFSCAEGERYDKWGNQILPSGIRLKGELFKDADCQRMLQAAGNLGRFAKYLKYPRTMHLPWSPGLRSDDRVIKSLAAFDGQEVVVTEKRDGENTTLYSDYLHARSIDSKDHPARSVIRQLHGAFKHEIPEGWRICAENLYAQHSIAYDDLSAYFEVLNVWDENNVCISWDDTLACCAMIGVGIGQGFHRGLPLVPVLYRGPWNEAKIREISQSLDQDQVEGYVVRVAGRIHYSEWRNKAAKFVRAEHVQTDEHWLRNWRPNSLRAAPNAPANGNV